MRFSRLACAIVVEAIRAIIPCDAGKGGAARRGIDPHGFIYQRTVVGQLEDTLKLILPE
jgi:hypothetical protein